MYLLGSLRDTIYDDDVKVQRASGANSALAVRLRREARNATNGSLNGRVLLSRPLVTRAAMETIISNASASIRFREMIIDDDNDDDNDNDNEMTA